MKRTAKEWQELLNLEQEPDDELLELLEASRDDIIDKPKHSPFSHYSFGHNHALTKQLLENKLQLLRAEIQKGSDQIENGDYCEINVDNLENFFDDIKQRGREKLKNKS
jgi:hypothetical protein